MPAASEPGIPKRWLEPPRRLPLRIRWQVTLLAIAIAWLCIFRFAIPPSWGALWYFACWLSLPLAAAFSLGIAMDSRARGREGAFIAIIASWYLVAAPVWQRGSGR
jgi:hypothetical protein